MSHTLLQYLLYLIHLPNSLCTSLSRRATLPETPLIYKRVICQIGKVVQTYNMYLIAVVSNDILYNMMQKFILWLWSSSNEIPPYDFVGNIFLMCVKLIIPL